MKKYPKSILVVVASIVTITCMVCLLRTFHQPSSEAVVANDTLAATRFYSHDAYLDAIEMQESGGNALAMGDYSKRTGEYRAIGSFQIWKIYIRDFNRIQELNKSFHTAVYSDRWDPVASRKIVAVVTAHYANHDWRDKPHTQLQWIETAVRSHKNPTERNKESTKLYWLEVKARMNGSIND